MKPMDFIRSVDDYIQAVVSPKEDGTMQYDNVPAVHIKGIEGEIQYNWQNRLQLSGNIQLSGCTRSEKI